VYETSLAIETRLQRLVDDFCVADRQRRDDSARRDLAPL
jgi:hypothetical protein